MATMMTALMKSFSTARGAVDASEKIKAGHWAHRRLIELSGTGRLDARCQSASRGGKRRFVASSNLWCTRRALPWRFNWSSSLSQIATLPVRVSEFGANEGNFKLPVTSAFLIKRQALAVASDANQIRMRAVIGISPAGRKKTPPSAGRSLFGRTVFKLWKREGSEPWKCNKKGVRLVSAFCARRRVIYFVLFLAAVTYAYKQRFHHLLPFLAAARNKYPTSNRKQPAWQKMDLFFGKSRRRHPMIDCAADQFLFAGEKWPRRGSIKLRNKVFE